MADLLKRLKISEQQYGVGMEDNPFQDVSNDEAMKVCFGGGGGSPPPPPPTTMTQQTSNIPEYFQPYLERLFERAEAVTTEPFQRYEGQRLALPTEQQQQAYQGVEQMVGGYKPYIATADLLTAQAAQQSTDPAAVAARMSPYQQAVVDIQKREALRDANKLQQQIGASAVGAGAFGGSRQALAETELARQTGQRLADIQAVGSQQAFQQAMNQLSADRAASLAAGQQFAGLGAQQQQLGLAGLGALETVGGTQQAQQQKALDIAYEDFARETTRPSQQVQEMSSVLRGFNLPVSTYTTSQAQQAPPTFGQQAAGLGLGALGIYGAGKGVGLFAGGGDVPDNPGIKKLAAKAPQVVEKMGFNPQEVINAYMGGKINYAPGGITEAAEQSKTSFFGPSIFEDIKEGAKKTPGFIYDLLTVPTGSLIRGPYDATSKATEYLTGFDMPSFREAFPERSKKIDEFEKRKDIMSDFRNIGKMSDKVKEKETETEVPPATDEETGGKTVPSVQDQINSLLSAEGEKGTAMADLKKLLAEDKRDAEDAGIQQAIAGLQAVVEGENIRTGRVPLGEMGERIAGVGKSFKAIEDAKRNVTKDKIANTALLAGLEQQEAKQLSAVGAAKAKMVFDMYKLGAEQQASALEAVMGDGGGLMLLRSDIENGTDNFGKLLDTIVKKTGGGPRVKDGLLMGNSPTDKPLKRIKTGV